MTRTAWTVATLLATAATPAAAASGATMRNAAVDDQARCAAVYDIIGQSVDASVRSRTASARELMKRTGLALAPDATTGTFEAKVASTMAQSRRELTTRAPALGARYAWCDKWAKALSQATAGLEGNALAIRTKRVRKPPWPLQPDETHVREAADGYREWTRSD